MIGAQIKGLIFLSSDIHVNEFHEIVLASESGAPDKRAPEFVSSPLGNYESQRDLPGWSATPTKLLSSLWSAVARGLTIQA